jgi:PEGA domain/Domain of unknown function (DUF4410)
MRTPVVLLLLVMALSSRMLAEELDTFNLHDPAGWSCAKRIVVRPFLLIGKFKGLKSQADYMRQFVDQLASAMNGHSGIESISLVEEGTPTGNADVVIEGHWRELNEGSRAARFWVGFGAGKARAEVAVSARALPDGRPLFDLVHARLSAMGLSKDELGEDVSEIASDIAEALLEARGVCIDAARRVPTGKGGLTESVPIAIDSEPSGAEVYVDDVFAGTAPLPSYRLPPGDHAVELRKDGYISWIRKIRITSGAPTQVKAVLLPEPPK